MKSWTASHSKDVKIWLRDSNPEKDKYYYSFEIWVVKSINSKGYRNLCCRQGTQYTVSLSWDCSLAWKDNRGRDLACKGTSCQRSPLSCPLVPKSLS